MTNEKRQRRLIRKQTQTHTNKKKTKNVEVDFFPSFSVVVHRCLVLKLYAAVLPRIFQSKKKNVLAFFSFFCLLSKYK